MEAETTYGVRKRFHFFEHVIDTLRPATVLDVGCGTGGFVTRPLARRFPVTRFVGADEHAGSLAFGAEQAALPNLSFVGMGEAARLPPADLVIASEVLEHVEDPDAFLRFLRGRLAPDGVLIVTIPNGYGPFEWASLVESLLVLTGAYAVVRDVKRALFGRASPPDGPRVDTLAVSPHVNFFSRREMVRLARRAGLRIRVEHARTFLCGFGFEHVMRNRRLIEWNARVADRLPRWLASGWMFLLEPVEPEGAGSYRRGPYARARRAINLRRFGTGKAASG